MWFAIIPALIIILLFIISVIRRIPFIRELIKTTEEIDFIQGRTDIPDKRILNKYLHVGIIYKVAKSATNSDYKIFDVSEYEKNNVIGLTYFVQEQDFEMFKRKAITRIMAGIDLDELDDESREILQAGLAQDNFISIIDDCTVYQLKDGRWLWRENRT